MAAILGLAADDVERVCRDVAGKEVVSPANFNGPTQVVIAGTGFDGGALRVFFGGVEGTVDSSTPNSITATVPESALPGLVWVLIGNASADGIVGFQPLDEDDFAIPVPATPQLSQLFPGAGPTESVIRVYGYNLTSTDFSRYDGEWASRILNLTTIDVPPIGDIRFAFAIPFGGTPAGDVDFTVDTAGVISNKLPYTIE